jgi:TonB family protein
MSLQKRCFVASATTHGLLVVLLFVGSAFLPKKEPLVDLPLLDFVPDQIINEALYGGGPAGAGAPPPPSEPVEERPLPAPEPAPVPPAIVPEPVPEPEVVKPLVVREPEVAPPTRNKPEVRPKPALPEVKPQPRTRPEIKPNLDRIERRTSQTAANKAKAKAEAEARQRAAQRKVAEIQNQLRSGLSGGVAIPGTEISTSGGFGTGGPSYASYLQVLKTKYDNAWDAPSESENETTSAQAKVVIARSGKVVSATISRSSGNAALDRSVHRALRLDFIAPFPESVKADEQTFYINFNLKSKRGRG